MRSITNLAWPTTPFGAGQRPFGRDRPMLAAVSAGWTPDGVVPVWACVVYLTIVNRRALLLDGQHLNFGFEVLVIQRPESPTELVRRLDEILVACRRQAAILTGHDLGPDLGRLATFATERRLPGIAALNEQWTDRTIKGRGMATMLDTAHDCDQPRASPD
jgi:hypothetical protein